MFKALFMAGIMQFPPKAIVMIRIFSAYHVLPVNTYCAFSLFGFAY